MSINMVGYTFLHFLQYYKWLSSSMLALSPIHMVESFKKLAPGKLIVNNGEETRGVVRVLSSGVPMKITIFDCHHIKACTSASYYITSSFLL